MARSQKPFLVEVKRGRRGAVVAPPAVKSKPPEAALKKRAVESFFAPPPEPPKPQRRILDAIEPEPVLPPVAEEEAPVVVDPFKRRRGRPPKVAGALPTPKKQRPAFVALDETPVIAVVPPVAAKRIAPVPPSREARIVSRPQVQNHGESDGYFISQPRKAPPAPAQAQLNHGAATHGQTTHSNTAHQTTHGHVTHVARVEAATSLPRGERWKRRLPKVLW